MLLKSIKLLFYFNFNFNFFKIANIFIVNNFYMYIFNTVLSQILNHKIEINKKKKMVNTIVTRIAVSKNP